MSTLRTPKRLKYFQSKSHERSPKQEASVAKRLGGQRVRGSGSGIEKGDVRLKRIARIEAKTTGAKSFSVTRDMVAKIESAAIGAGEIPALVVEFNNDGKPESEVAVVPMWALKSLVGE